MKNEAEAMKQMGALSLAFPGIERSSSDIEHWMSFLNLNQAEILNSFRGQKTNQLQSYLNELAKQKDLWMHEFLFNFLGITDRKVL